MGCNMAKEPLDLTNMVLGRLTVISRADDTIDTKGYKHDNWLCKCTCGTIKVVRGKALRTSSHPTRSCGCLQREKVSELARRTLKKYNTYSDKMSDENGEYYIGYCSNTGREFFVDAKDFETIKEYCWREHHPSVGFSTLVAHNPETKKDIKMHQLLGMKYGDHIDRNELNNRRYNLRGCNFSQNAQNRSMQSNNSTGIAGVTLIKETGFWEARIGLANGEKIRKHFKNFNDAVVYRLQMEKEHYGEFAPQKHLYSQYGIEVL